MFFLYLYIIMSVSKNTGYTVATLSLFFLLGLLVGVVMMQRRYGPSMVRVFYPQGTKIDAVMQMISNNYVDTVDSEKLTQAGLEAIMHGLDPHSSYIKAREFAQAEEEIQGNFHGIGVQFRMINDTVTVIMPVSGGPSEKVGIMAGDRIIVADQDTLSGKRLSTDFIMKKLKGPKGTKVRLGILRADESQLRWVEVRRDVIPTYSVDAHFVVKPGIGYLKVSKFTATTAEEFRSAIKDLKREGVGKLVVDLRSNGGGLLSTCLEICDLFLKEGDVIVYTEGRNRQRTEIHASGKGPYQDIPVVVLMDEWSASASEIFAGALQDNDRGLVMGRRSFGKGLVQEQIALGDGSAIRLTVARYYTPSGRCIQKPYQGSYEDYEADVLQRYMSGEMTGKDSTLHGDTTRYYTKNGRVVYGGGGIHPDILVPYKTDTLFVYLNRINNGLYSYDFSFDYANRNRSSLKRRYPDARSFTRDFKISDVLFEDFLQYTEDKGLERDTASIRKYGEDMKLTLKALIGRDLYDDEGFYPSYLQRDDDFIEALKVLEGERKVEGFSTK